MKYLKLILWGLGSFLLASEASGGASGAKHLSSASNRRDIYQATKDFKCPFPFGAFSDPEDCAHYYVCVAGVAVHRKCGILQHFDIWRRKCMPILVAICGNDKTKTTAVVTSTTKKSDKTKTTAVVTSTTKTSGDEFKCPKFRGSFPHPTDCSKYFNCFFYMASLNTCAKDQLFDVETSSCKPEKEVNCGTRQRPGYTTIEVSTEPIVTEISEAISTEKVTAEPTSEATDATKLKTTAEEIRTKEVITESTFEVIDTTTIGPTGPPDHNCDEDDVDCIITETGDVEVWFRCPRDIGSFPHPSSDKLFIFCMNWIPSVKKCGMNLVFSKDHSTCV